MTPPRVSIVIVSNGRPAELAQCLDSLQFQTHPDFEVVVVSDHLPPEYHGRVHHIAFERQNISAARNLGLAHAAAEIVAFCDDDAIPDPPWLARLIAPFNQPEVAASGGFTRGRNGISRQWGAMRFDRTGADYPFKMGKDVPFVVYLPDPDRPVKLVGTNMAFRRAALIKIGGFDESFRFYLEDADVKLRLDAAGYAAALVPAAQVQHGFAASNRRNAERVPLDLHEIGASKALFCKKHLEGASKPVLQAFRVEQSGRLADFQKRRLLGATHSATLRASLEAGFVEGAGRKSLTGIQGVPREFLPFATKRGPHVVICVRKSGRQRAQDMAVTLGNASCAVSVIEMNLSPRFFQVCFVDGHWRHVGGQFGRSYRNQPLFQPVRFAKRCQRELDRLSSLWPVDVVLAENRGAGKALASCLARKGGSRITAIHNVATGNRWIGISRKY